MLPRTETNRSWSRHTRPSAAGRPLTSRLTAAPGAGTTEMVPPAPVTYRRPSGPKAMAVGSGSPEAYTQAAKPGITWIDGSAGNVIAARGVAVGVGVGGRAVTVA